mmetsp:Transcript_77798/g.225790  ORF Transcript_77798/g.225790 Transcript_77798/m.225790 type:complete len:206 (+) Transcript_77798:657-1274(+)
MWRRVQRRCSVRGLIAPMGRSSRPRVRPATASASSALPRNAASRRADARMTSARSGAGRSSSCPRTCRNSVRTPSAWRPSVARPLRGARRRTAPWGTSSSPAASCRRPGSPSPAVCPTSARGRSVATHHRTARRMSAPSACGCRRWIPYPSARATTALWRTVVRPQGSATTRSALQAMPWASMRRGSASGRLARSPSVASCSPRR